MYKYLLNNVIAADDLHWDENEKRYVSLSADEVTEIVARCLEQQVGDLEEIMKVISWCGHVRIGQIIMKNFLSGSVIVTGFDEEDEPLFSPEKK